MCCSNSHGQVHHADTAETYPDDSSRECRCTGPNGTALYCCGAITGDDGLCDRCRTHCKSTDAATTGHDHGSEHHGQELVAVP